MDIKKFINQIFHDIANDDLEIAIDKLHGILSESQLIDDLVVQSSRYSSIIKQIRKGTINFEEADVTINKIRYAIVDIIRDLESLIDEKDYVKKEFESLSEDSYGQINKSESNSAVNGNNNSSIAISGISSGSSTNISINKTT